MKEHSLFPHALRGCLVNLVNIVLVLGAMVLSVNYRYPEHPLCRGGLGAGFPVLLICDAGVGGSPISSWGKITFVDIPNGGIRPGGFLLDFLFYSACVWILWILAAWIFPQGLPHRDLGWAALINVVYIIGFLCASLLFFSSELYSKGYARTPTPNITIIPSATPLGTPPSLVTPIPTLGP